MIGRLETVFFMVGLSKGLLSNDLFSATLKACGSQSVNKDGLIIFKIKAFINGETFFNNLVRMEY